MKKSLVAVFLASAAAASAAPSKPAAADAIWFNGPVVTIDDAHPSAEAAVMTHRN